MNAQTLHIAERDRRLCRKLLDEWKSGRGREHSSEDMNWLSTLVGRLIARRQTINSLTH